MILFDKYMAMFEGHTNPYNKLHTITFTSIIPDILSLQYYDMQYLITAKQ